MKIAHIYARYSTGTQAKGTSLRRQISNAEAFAAEQGWTIADIILTKASPHIAARTWPKGVSAVSSMR